MIEKINPTIPIPITSSPIPDEQREIIMAKSSIAIPNPIFFIVNPPLQMSICCHLHYTSLAIEKIAYFMKLVGWVMMLKLNQPKGGADIFLDKLNTLSPMTCDNQLGFYSPMIL